MKHRTPNNVEVLYAVDSISGEATYITATNHILDTTAGGGGGGGAVTVADGADVTQGAIADAAVTAGSTGTLSGKLRTISADIATIKTTGHPVTGTVAISAAALPLPAGAATSALQTTGNTSLSSIDGKITAVNTGAVVLAAGAASIGKLAANAGVTIGAVEIAAAQTLATVTTVTTLTGTTTLTPGTAAANLGKAEDAGHTTGDVGVMALGVRNDTLADVTSTTADYSQLSTDLKGRLITANAPRTLRIQQQTTITSSTSETTVLTQVASTFLDVYGVVVTNTSATGCGVVFKDSTGGTERFRIWVPATETRGFMLPMDAAHNQTTVNTNWTATCSASVASVYVTVFAVKMI